MINAAFSDKEALLKPQSGFNGAVLMAWAELTSHRGRVVTDSSLSINVYSNWSPIKSSRCPVNHLQAHQLARCTYSSTTEAHSQTPKMCACTLYIYMCVYMHM